MRAVLLANMGAPASEVEMKLFLKNMFKDKAIIHAPAFVRLVLSYFISRLRYKSSWQKYVQIGGSPLQQSMSKMATDLKQKLGDAFLVEAVYSYSQPNIEERIANLYAQSVRNFTVISMYPQASFSTTGSVQTSINAIKRKFHDIELNFIEDFYDHPQFIQFWQKKIHEKIESEQLTQPFLLFSAHAIPLSFVKRGDRYAEKIKASAQLIANQLQLPHIVGFQSKIGPTEWTRPYSNEALKELVIQGASEIIVVPISFLNENLETRYDLDLELIPYATNTLNIRKVSRIILDDSDPLLTNLFYGFISPIL